MRPVPALVLLALALAACGGSDPRELLPDLDQAAPGRVAVQGRGAEYWLVFDSAVDNVGTGSMLVVGRRAPGEAAMVVEQLVERDDGSVAHRAVDAVMRYERSDSHEHWHLIGFERYELRRAEDFALVVPSRKAGFCLRDQYETSTAELDGEPPAPVWTRECGRGGRRLTSVRAGISVGFGDEYVPALEGQYVEATDVPPGRYVLVHRVNPEHDLLESRYDNNAASLLLELGERSVRVLARCPDSERCG